MARFGNPSKESTRISGFRNLLSTRRGRSKQLGRDAHSNDPSLMLLMQAYTGYGLRR
jgi:hypothetical protein